MAEIINNPSKKKSWACSPVEISFKSAYQEEYKDIYKPFVKTLWKRDITKDKVHGNVSAETIQTKFP